METPEPQVVTSRKKLSRKKLVLLAAVVVAVVAIVAGYVWWQQTNQQTNKSFPQDPPYTTTREAYAKVHVDTLKNDPPTADASEQEKKDYYDELVTTEFTANNHQGVVETYETAAKTFGEEKLSFNMYIAAARSYAKLGDKSRADAVFVTADKFVNTSVTDEALKSDLKRSLEYFRVEIDQ